MANKIGEQFKSSWKSILWGLVPIAIVAIIFALPLKTIAVQTTVKYWDTEIKSEPYTVQESYTDTESYVTTEMKTETIYNAYLSPSKTHTFQVDKPGSTVAVSLEGLPYYNYPQYYIVYDPDGDPVYRFWPYGYWGGQTKLIIKLSYPEEVTKERTVTKLRDVTKYRDVPTQVLKEKTATDYKKISIWSYLFTDQQR